MSHKKFEYLHINSKNVSFDEFKLILDEKGQEGWEFINSPYMFTWLFKRQIIDNIVFCSDNVVKGKDIETYFKRRR